MTTKILNLNSRTKGKESRIMAFLKPISSFSAHYLQAKSHKSKRNPQIHSSNSQWALSTTKSFQNSLSTEAVKTYQATCPMENQTHSLLKQKQILQLMHQRPKRSKHFLIKKMEVMKTFWSWGKILMITKMHTLWLSSTHWWAKEKTAWNSAQFGNKEAASKEDSGPNFSHSQPSSISKGSTHSLLLTLELTL